VNASPPSAVFPPWSGECWTRLGLRRPTRPVVPVLFYPFSKTIWAAIDMIMHRGQVFADYPGPPAGIR